MDTWATRAVAALAGGVAAVVFTAGVAFAHVEVSADPPVAGATHAVLTFTAEAESPTSGVVSVSIQLPAGISAADVSLNKAPDGWKLTPIAEGYQVAGAAQPKGQEVVHSIVVDHLPDASALTFKAVVTYADGSADHWIEEKTPTDPDPDHPAPVLQLQTPRGALTATSPSVTATAAVAPAGKPNTPWWLYVVFIAVALGAVLGSSALARRLRDRRDARSKQ